MSALVDMARAVADLVGDAASELADDDLAELVAELRRAADAASGEWVCRSSGGGR